MANSFTLADWLATPRGARCLLQRGGSWWLGGRPVAVQHIADPEGVPALLADAEAAASKGQWAVLALAYEAASGCDPRLATHPPITGQPVAALLVFDEWLELTEVNLPTETQLDIRWEPTVTETEYMEACAAIHEAIARGDTYQVNFTYRLRAQVPDCEPLALFATLLAQQPTQHAAYLELGDLTLCSVSPELFFTCADQQLTTRPMKGTASRGRTTAEDAHQAAWLASSAKNRAENVMIVDMLRNDLGRIARTGTVRVPALFTIERYPTVFQMTSTVTAESNAALPELMRALFPCASVTGAPKVRTMEFIRALESTPRGFYCGALGSWGPGRQGEFSVAIRTLIHERTTGQLEYSTGSGIVWDSDPLTEFRECQTKALVLKATPAFQLLEGIRWELETGCQELTAHLARLADSAAYFDFRCDLDTIRAALAEATFELPPLPHRIRLMLHRSGEFALTCTPIEDDGQTVWRIAVAREPVDSADRFLYHKTTLRERYTRALADFPGADEVLLFNERGELTEGTRSNVMLKVGADWITPAASAGLLPGIARQRLLAAGTIREAVIPMTALGEAEEIWLVNAVRGMKRGVRAD